MSACRSWRDHLVEAVFGELEGERRRDFEAHLETCPACRSELEGFEATTARIAEAMPPRPRTGDVDLWHRIAPELDAPERPPRPRGLVLGYGAAAALATVLLAVGLGLGFWLKTPTTSPAPIAAVEDSASDVELARFLERSTPLLLAVANRRFGGAELASFDPAVERRLAERLAADAGELALKLDDTGRRRQADLLRDLEVVFLQLANLPEREYRHGIEMVQSTIEDRALLFQLSVEEMRHL